VLENIQEVALQPMIAFGGITWRSTCVAFGTRDAFMIV